MRFLQPFTLALALAVACGVSVLACGPTASPNVSLGGDGSADPFGETAPGQCATDGDCRPAASTCCECPTFAVTTGDPIATACTGVTCPVMPTCAATVAAICEQGRCTLACEPMACAATYDGGYALDGSGCLTCAPAAPVADATACASDGECVETRADCCGCAAGGADTAVLAGTEAAFDASLACDPHAACPAISTCEADAAPRCVQGRCALLAGAAPANACGGANLPACSAGQVCTVNLDPDATDRGLGVCADPR